MKLTPTDFKAMKNHSPIAMLTAYTFPVAKCLEEAGIPVVLVGDTVGMVEMGFSSTQYVTLDHMVYHIGAVRRGAPNTHIIGDMPWQSDKDEATALNSARLLLDAGADSVKLEGARYDIIKHLVDNGIPVVGHTGLTPQTASNFKQVGRDLEDAQRILQEARGIEAAGAFMLVLEHIPAQLGERITDQLAIPTIGIGAGPQCDGQVLVVNDAMGVGTVWPPFSKQYAHINEIMLDAANEFKKQVEEGTF